MTYMTGKVQIYNTTVSSNALASRKSASVKALGEPPIDRREELVRLGALAQALPQAGQAHDGTHPLEITGVGVTLSACGPRPAYAWGRPFLFRGPRATLP